MNIGNENNILFYNDKEGNVRAEVIVQDENVWLNVEAIARLLKYKGLQLLNILVIFIMMKN